MHFLSPFALLGMVATVIPVAIHLLNRGQSQPLPFSNLRFLRALDQTRMRNLRLRQWLVLLLRTLVVALIVLAFSRPSYTESGTGLLGSSVPTAAVVLLDRSYSAAYRQPEGRLFDLLRAQATGLLGLFSPRDEVTVLPFAARPEQPLENPDRMLDLVRELTPGEGITDIESALEAAALILTPRPDWNREILLLTDLARYNWSEVTPRDADWLPDASIYVSDPADGERANIYVRDLRLDSWMQTAGGKHVIHVVLGNSSSRPATAISADLYVNGERVQRRELDLPPGEYLQADFTFTPRVPGPLTGYVQIEDDGLALDNRRYFALQVPGSLRLLLVGGSGGGDTYYARRALTAGTAVDPVLDVREALMADLSSEILTGTDVVALCNLVRLTPEHTRLLHDYAADGGGIIIFPSPRIDLSYLNRHLLPGLVPATVKGRLGVPGSDGPQFHRLDPTRPYHPLFDGLLSSDLDRPRFWASFEILPKPYLRPLILFDDGRPALVEGWVGEGSVLLFAGPLDLEWNDLPLRGLFVPLLHRLSRYLSLRPEQGRSYLVGQTARRHVPGLAAEARVQAESPSGRRFHLEAELSGGRIFWSVPPLAESGLWRLLSGGEVVDRFPVNIDTRESDLTPMSAGELSRIFGPGRIQMIRPDDDLREAVLLNRYGRELWRECLLLAVCLLLWELWLSRAPQEERKAATRGNSGGRGGEAFSRLPVP